MIAWLSLFSKRNWKHVARRWIPHKSNSINILCVLDSSWKIPWFASFLVCAELHVVFVLTVEAREAEHADLLCDVVPSPRCPQSLELLFQLSPHQQDPVSHGLHVALPSVRNKEVPYKVHFFDECLMQCRECEWYVMRTILQRAPVSSKWRRRCEPPETAGWTTWSWRSSPSGRELSSGCRHRESRWSGFRHAHLMILTTVGFKIYTSYPLNYL